MIRIDKNEKLRVNVSICTTHTEEKRQNCAGRGRICVWEDYHIISVFPYIHTNVHVHTLLLVLAKMNRHISSLLIAGKLAEKRSMDKSIIKASLEQVILNFHEFAKIGKENFLLKNILQYTKIVSVSSFHLEHLYINIIEPLLRNKQINVELLPNIVHTYKKDEKYNYILNKINDCIVENIEKRRMDMHDDPNTWLGILQVLSSKKKNVNFIPLLKCFLIKKKKNCSLMDEEGICYTRGNNNKSSGSGGENHAKCLLRLEGNVNYEALGELTPRSFSILINILSRVKIRHEYDFQLNSFFLGKIINTLPEFNNIDFCLIVEAFHKFRYANEYFITHIEIEILRRKNTFHIFQLSLIFHNLSQYWNDKINTLFSTLFMKKIKKYLSLYFLFNRDEKYILFSKNKISLLEIMPMFFLAYKKICIHDTDNKDNIVDKLRGINQTICNFIFSFIGYTYNILTLHYAKWKEKEKLFTHHFFLTLNNIYRLIHTRMNIWNHQLTMLTEEGGFHREDGTNMAGGVTDSYHFPKLEHVRNIYALFPILDQVNLNPLMQESLEGKNMFVSNIYLHILNCMNDSFKSAKNGSFVFKRRIIGPYTISELCRSNVLQKGAIAFAFTFAIVRPSNGKGDRGWEELMLPNGSLCKVVYDTAEVKSKDTKFVLNNS
ncbi:hypothetical protein, conserved [Plasmodium ovale curtisi]|uniref:Uncharacterized protein n=1 Tax=Plasmodium ovale curtisi TaxID=864141 RepID=A0A1A8X6X7_PLAOA|nr:hypothetical protein, conserved [Plasmodium ovale curtisi]SBT00365.1 hypothetical protein, conserved [Plasmodium ovale curtisi]